MGTRDALLEKLSQIEAPEGGQVDKSRDENTELGQALLDSGLLELDNKHSPCARPRLMRQESIPEGSEEESGEDKEASEDDEDGSGYFSCDNETEQHDTQNNGSNMTPGTSNGSGLCPRGAPQKEVIFLNREALETMFFKVATKRSILTSSEQ